MKENANGIEIVERGDWPAFGKSRYQDLIDALKRCGEGQAVRFAREVYPKLKSSNLSATIGVRFPQQRIRIKTESETHFLVWLEDKR